MTIPTTKFKYLFDGTSSSGVMAGDLMVRINKKKMAAGSVSVELAKKISETFHEDTPEPARISQIQRWNMLEGKLNHSEWQESSLYFFRPKKENLVGEDVCAWVSCLINQSNIFDIALVNGAIGATFGRDTVHNLDIPTPDKSIRDACIRQSLEVEKLKNIHDLKVKISLFDKEQANLLLITFLSDVCDGNASAIEHMKAVTSGLLEKEKSIAEYLQTLADSNKKPPSGPR